MPKIRPGMKKPPADFANIADELDAFEAQLKDALYEERSTESGKPARKHEATWTVAKINRERARCVLDAVKSRKISEVCLKYCCDMNFVDAGLIKCWRLSGYERLCCTSCVKGASGKVCVCRVPGKKLSAPCTACGCLGCTPGAAKDEITGGRSEGDGGRTEIASHSDGSVPLDSGE